MNEHAIAIFSICDEMTQSLGIADGPQQKMTNAEVMAFALISALYYHANYRTTRLVAKSLRYFLYSQS